MRLQRKLPSACFYTWHYKRPLNICPFSTLGLKVTAETQPELHMDYNSNSQLTHSDPTGNAVMFYKREAKAGGTDKNMQVKWVYQRASRGLASVHLQLEVQRLRDT